MINCRYIEKLHGDKQSVGDWEKSLTATPENTKTDQNRLPANWLAQGAGYHGNVTNALWALRDLMLKDTLNLTRVVPFDALCEYTLNSREYIDFSKIICFVLHS